ncbi:GGDEF domain-containing protein [Thermus scotoductus]|uniref:GGDEF domain-containing protein n=1 Tax=Thermus scotoductus TaxID=37636 RepID=A0A430VNU3_THESC|nr:GGDEF domain-containing protein [Thermus scotoductus]RTI54456.1 GGDEF domain-containing protein [Thermus scotoductus]
MDGRGRVFYFAGWAGMALGLLLQAQRFPPQGLEVLLYAFFVLWALWALRRGPKVAPRLLLHPLGAYLLFEMWRVGENWPLVGLFIPALYLLAGFAYPPWSLGHLLGAFWGGVLVLAPLVLGRNLDFWPHFAVSQVILLSLTFLLARFREAHGQMRFWKEQALTDPLTGLPNRRALEMAMEREAARVERGERPFSLVLVDLDDFKRVNDTHGHQVGDRILKEVAQYLVAHVRQGDLVGRWGGEEFAVILPRTEGKEAVQVADRLREGLKTLGITASFGVAVYGGDPRDLFQRADRALYQAKGSGKNQVRLDSGS